MKLSDVLAKRETTHGNWIDNAWHAQRMKEQWRKARGWQRLSCCQREALEMIAHKVARILSGDPNERDHWLDIGGYVELVLRELDGGKHGQT